MRACRSRASPSLGRAGAGHPTLADSSPPRTRPAPRARTIYSSDAPGASRSHSSSHVPVVRRLHSSSDVRASGACTNGRTRRASRARTPPWCRASGSRTPPRKCRASRARPSLRTETVLLGGHLSRPSSSASCASVSYRQNRKVRRCLK